MCVAVVPSIHTLKDHEAKIMNPQLLKDVFQGTTPEVLMLLGTQDHRLTKTRLPLA